MSDTAVQHDLFADKNSTRRVIGRKCPVLVIAGSTGGAGTTMVAAMTAETAAGPGRVPRVVLVDAQTGRNDLRSWLCVSAKVPSVDTAMVESDPKRALTDNTLLNKSRPDHLHDISFGAILPAPDVFTPYQFVLDAIDVARDVADIVIVDVGVYSCDPDGCYSKVGLPLISTGAWFLGVTPMSRNAASAAQEMFGHLSTQSIPRDRISFLVNRYSPEFALASSDGASKSRLALFGESLIARAHNAGAVAENAKDISSVMIRGQIPTRSVELSSLVAALLQRITGRESFEALSTAASVGSKMLKSFGDGYDNQEATSAATKGRFSIRRGVK